MNNRICFIIIKMLIITLFMFLVIGCKTISRGYDLEWNNRLTNKKILEKYIEGNNGVLWLKDLKLENYNLDGIILKKLIIENTSMNNITMNESKIGSMIVTDSDLSQIKMTFTEIGELVIQNSYFDDVNIGSNDIIKTEILKSNIINSRIDIESDSAVIDNSYIKRSTFTRSIFKTLKITNTKFDESKLNYFGNTKIDSLLIKDSSLNVTFGGSKIKEVILENVSGDFLRITGNTVFIRDSNVNTLALGGIQKLNSFESVNSKIKNFSFSSTKIKKISVKNCFRKTGVSFRKSLVEIVEIDNCDLGRLVLSSAKIDKISLKNADIYSNSWVSGSWRKTRIEELILENVFIDGIFTMKNAYIGTLKTKNLKKGRNLDINYTGANFKF